MASASSRLGNSPQTRCIIFDLDGTLVRSAVNFVRLKSETIRVLKELGLPTTSLSEKMKTYQIMAKVQEHVKTGETHLPYEEIARRVTQVWDSCELERVTETTIMTGALEVLETLSGRGFSIGIVTRGCHAYAVRALETTGLIPFVDLILGRDDTANPKPDPEPLLYAMSVLRAKRSEVVMVGDSAEDSECARLAGVRFIGVKGGALSIDRRKPTEAGLVELQNLASLLE
jgi:HAD superfamily hydrolase (TIGR01549 family)